MPARQAIFRWCRLAALLVLPAACGYDLPDESKVDLVVVVRGVPVGTRVLEVELKPTGAAEVVKTPPFSTNGADVEARFSDVPEGDLVVTVRALDADRVERGSETQSLFFDGQRTQLLFDIAIDPECNKDSVRCRVPVAAGLRGVVKVWPVPGRDAALALASYSSSNRTGTLHWVPLVLGGTPREIASGVPESGGVAVAADGRVAVVADVGNGDSGKLYLLDDQGNRGPQVAERVPVGTTLNRRQRVVFTRNGNGPLLYLSNSTQVSEPGITVYRGRLFLRRAGAADSLLLGENALWPSDPEREATVLAYQHTFSGGMWKVSQVSLANANEPAPVGDAQGTSTQAVVAASRDGGTIAHFTAAGRVRVLGLTGGESFDGGRYLTVSSDGKRAAWLTRGNASDPWSVFLVEESGTTLLEPPVGSVLIPSSWPGLPLPLFGRSGDGGGLFFLTGNQSNGGELWWKGHGEESARRLVSPGLVSELRLANGSHAFLTAYPPNTSGGSLYVGRDEAPSLSPAVSTTVRGGAFSFTRDGSRLVYLSDQTLNTQAPGKLQLFQVTSREQFEVATDVRPGLYDFTATGDVAGIAWISGRDSQNNIPFGRLGFFEFRARRNADTIEEAGVSAVALLPGTDKLVYAIAEGSNAGVYTAWRIPKVTDQ